LEVSACRRIGEAKCFSGTADAASLGNLDKELDFYEAVHTFSFVAL
jgi:hypothetical protein